MAGHRSSAAPLAATYAALIVYASLYPFSGWRLPGVSPWAFLAQPFPRYWTGFDLVSNLIGYLPLGMLLFVALVRSGWSSVAAGGATLVVGTALSLAMESLQELLPYRVASNVDWMLNIVGTVCGALLAFALNGLGWLGRWQALRDRWFIADSSGGLALLLLWPVGLLFPAPVPFGLGQVWPRLHDLLLAAVEDSAAGPWFESLLQGDADAAPLSPASELMAVALGLAAPCLVAYTISRPGWRRILLAVGAVVIGFGTMALSTALNFGPQHALAWRTPVAMAAVIAGFALVAVLAWVPRRVAAGVGLMVLAALVADIARAPADAYFAESLQRWEQGRFIHFHGLAQWVGWLWPYVAMAWLLARLALRDAGEPQAAS